MKVLFSNLQLRIKIFAQPTEEHYLAPRPFPLPKAWQADQRRNPAYTDSLFHRSQAWGSDRADLAGHQP